MSRVSLLTLTVALLFLSLVATPAQAAPAAQLAIEFEGEVLENANLRQGPGTDTPVVGKAQAGDILVFDGCNKDCEWYHLETGEWIAGFLVGPSPMLMESLTDELIFGPPSPGARELVAEILSYSGLPSNVAILEANIYNALAVTFNNGQRVILYDPWLMADIMYYTDNVWSAISILAHEIGHHLAGHTLTFDGEPSLSAELEADYFSGFVLYKMGATLEEAQSAIQATGSDMPSSSHPHMRDRLMAIEDGWRTAAGHPEMVPASSDFSPLIFCYAEEFDEIAGACTRYRTQFSGVVKSVYVSWKPSAAYRGAEFTKVWYLDGQQFLVSSSKNEFGYIEVDTRGSLKPGQYQLDLFANGVLVQQAIFTIR